MTDQFPTPERRMTTPIEVAKLSNGAKTSVITVIVLLVINMVGLTTYIVRDHVRQTMNEVEFTKHLTWSEGFAKDVTEMKLDIRELTVRSEYVAESVTQHRLTEPVLHATEPIQ